jgi:hypothetical protein
MPTALAQFKEMIEDVLKIDFALHPRREEVYTDLYVRGWTGGEKEGKGGNREKAGGRRQGAGGK